MTYEEFKARTTEKASYETFQKFERIYMAGDFDKDIFCKLLKPLVVAETEAAPFEKEAAAKKTEFFDALDKARAAMDLGKQEAFASALEEARPLGLAYMMARKKAKACYDRI